MKISKNDDDVCMTLSKEDLKELKAFLDGFFFIPKYSVDVDKISGESGDGLETFDKLLRALNLLFGDSTNLLVNGNTLSYSGNTILKPTLNNNTIPPPLNKGDTFTVNYSIKYECK